MSTHGLDTAHLRRLLAKATKLAQTLLGRGLVAVHGAVWEREPVRQVCPECQVDFAPHLTDNRCPVCSWQAPTDVAPVAPRGPARGTAGLGLAWFVAVLAFALLAHALYG